MQNVTVRRSCFICGEESGISVFPHDLEICGLGRVKYVLRCCDGCGFVRQDPAVSPQTMMRQYAMFSNYLAFDAGDPPLSPTAGRMMALVEEVGTPVGRVYDIGASTGSMLWHFRNAGWAVEGCDLSAQAVRQARARNGIELQHGDCIDTLPGDSSIDLVTLSHVLEHLYDPVPVLDRIHASLRPSGRLMFEVPCLTAPDRCPAGLFTMEHVNFFEAQSIQNLMARSGFEIERSKVTLDHFPYPVITVIARKAAISDVFAVLSARADNRRFLDEYALIEQESWRAVDGALRSRLQSDEPVFVWGAGVHTSMLLSWTSLDCHARIAAITDRDAQKHGCNIGEYPVVDPSFVLAGRHRIVISSYYSEASIVGGLLLEGVRADRIVRLYG